MHLILKKIVKTTGGNANGAACVFPFRYKNIVHHECTYENHPGFDNKKWCCTNSDCDASFVWGDCPETNIPFNSNNCTKDGYTSPDNGLNCYKVITSEKKSWQQAKLFCENNEGGKLASVRDGFEQGLY